MSFFYQPSLSSSPFKPNLHLHLPLSNQIFIFFFYFSKIENFRPKPSYSPSLFPFSYLPFFSRNFKNVSIFILSCICTVLNTSTNHFSTHNYVDFNKQTRQTKQNKREFTLRHHCQEYSMRPCFCRRSKFHHTYSAWMNRSATSPSLPSNRFIYFWKTEFLSSKMVMDLIRIDLR